MNDLDVQHARALLARHVHKMTTIQELSMRRALTREWLESAPSTWLCWMLSELLRGAVRGKVGCSDAVLALSLTLIHAQRHDDYEFFQELFTLAYEAQREELLFLFRNSAPSRQLAAEARLPEVKLPLDRDISLGERRTMASGRNRRYLERLLLDPNPMVIAKLLKNPALQHRDIVQIASRRPTTSKLLETVLDEERWLTHHEVRDALTRNPFIKTGYALKLLPTLHVNVLREVRDSSELHHGVNAFAGLLVRLHEWS